MKRRHFLQSSLAAAVTAALPCLALPCLVLYFEETELQHRLNRSGWQMIYVPAASVVHAAGASTGIAGGHQSRRRVPAYLYRSRWLYLLKTHRRPGVLLAALAVFPAGVLNILHRRLRGRAPTLPSHFFRDHLRFGMGQVSGFSLK